MSSEFNAALIRNLVCSNKVDQTTLYIFFEDACKRLVDNNHFYILNMAGKSFNFARLLLDWVPEFIDSGYSFDYNGFKIIFSSTSEADWIDVIW